MAPTSTGSSSGTCAQEVPNKNNCYANDKELKVLLCPPNLGLMFYLQQKGVCVWGGSFTSALQVEGLKYKYFNVAST